MRKGGSGKGLRWLSAGLMTILLCTAAVAVYASAGGGDQGAGHDSGRLMDLLYRCINFALLVIILVVVIKKTSLKDYFAQRREDIKRRMEELQKEKAAAEVRYQELEQKFKDFEVKKKEIVEQFKAEGLVEKDKIIAQAKDRAKQIMSQAESTIQREILGAKDRLREEIVNVAARKAQDLIVGQIKASDQEHLVDEFIERVGKLH